MAIVIVNDKTKQAYRIKEYHDAISAYQWKQSAKTATYSNIDIRCPKMSYIGGIHVFEEDIILVRCQWDKKENGLYVYNGKYNPMTRTFGATNFDGLINAAVFVEQGYEANSMWIQTERDGVIDVDAVSWQKLHNMIL